jgi:hypothetical protein
MLHASTWIRLGGSKLDIRSKQEAGVLFQSRINRVIQAQMSTLLDMEVDAHPTHAMHIDSIPAVF